MNSAQGASTSIKEEGYPFGLSEFERNQTGSNKKYEGASYGYVFPLGRGDSDNICIVPTETEIIAYVPDSVASTAGFSLESEDDQAALIRMVSSLDESLSNGGTKIGTLDEPWIWTSKRAYKQGAVTFTFDREIEDDYYYVTVEADDADAAHDAARFCLSGKMLPADQVVVAEEPTWTEQIASFLDPANLDYRPLWVSLKTAGVAMVFIFILGMLAAWRAMHVKSRWKGLFDSIFTIPMVLPPTVCGFILLVIFGQSTAFGRWLIDHGIELVFSWPAAVLAATVVGFPLMYRTVLGAFEALDVNMLDAARIFLRIMMPLAWPSIAAGTVLAFARAMGEFGATLFVAGNYAGVTQTMPIAIYFAWMGGKPLLASFWVFVVIVISFIIILIINLYSAHAQRYRRAGGKASKEEAVHEEGEVSFTLDEHVAAELGFGHRKDAAAEGALEAHAAPPEPATGEEEQR